jgi:capsular exopolysaccharide synthesis family protein
MSRNFELLHEAGKVQDMLRQRLEVAPPSSTFVIAGSPALHLDGPARDEVLKLVQSLFLANGPHRTRQVVLVGTEPGSGTSWMCAHTAEVLAAQGTGSVCVVDCNVMKPALHEQFHVQNHFGLADALLGTEPVRQYVQQLSRPNLWLLSGGARHGKSQELLTQETMRRRMLELRAEFDYVLLDLPPISGANYAAVLGSWCDGVALVVKANSTNRKDARQAVKDIQAANALVLGAILNQRTFPIPESIYNRL